MAIHFEHLPHPRILDRQAQPPPRMTDERLGVNSRIGLVLTATVGTMWCAYLFAIIALLVLPQAVGGGPLAFVQWLSQTFIQLVMLSVIMVGQNILGRAADRRSEMTYADADAAFHETKQIQAHLAAQDAAINELVATITRLEAALAGSSAGAAAATQTAAEGR
jgi:hypothetical protein